MEATEMAVRQAMHEVGAKVLTGLLREEPPLSRALACSCGGTANYIEMRPKSILTALGWAKMLRAYYLCDNCHVGQAPMDTELDVERTDFTPAVRRMMALVGHQAPFDLGRQQIEALAGLVVTAKAVERTAESIGADIAGWQEN